MGGTPRLVRRGGVFYFRMAVPKDFVPVVGRGEVNVEGHEYLQEAGRGRGKPEDGGRPLINRGLEAIRRLKRSRGACLAVGVETLLKGHLAP